MLTTKEIKHIAKLARLELTAEEEEKFSRQISSILEYVEKINKLDTKGIEPISQITGLENAVREDDIIDSVIQSDILKSAPDRDGNLFKVKSVFE
ncbi:Asp-tRNA(Asn)/Glu-tRNA(Gln) amidotransferase subunit GatC [Candidatus Parcubacteria bacterium]|nr:Asp-tRNA(Asn)/Glu-tRNA(Gln) amidotransferase subunit GatC [Candidatus Parcubacteria bacterium]